RRTLMPSFVSQRHRLTWPCHLAFQLGSRTTAGPVALARKKRACTRLLFAYGDAIWLVNVSTCPPEAPFRGGCHTESSGGAVANHSSLCANVSSTQAFRNPRGSGSSALPPMCSRPHS